MLPLRTKVGLPDGSGLLGLMPGYLGTPQSFGLKVVTVMPGNHGTPFDSHQGVVMLFGVERGEPLAILDATAITAIRTAAASAAATDVLARPDAGDLALLGSGAQGRTHLAAMRAVRALRRVRVWSRTRANAERLAKEAADPHGPPLEVVASAEEAVKDADLVCTTTAAREPILEGRWLAPGAHVNAVGACFAAEPRARHGGGAPLAPVHRLPRVVSQRGRRFPDRQAPRGPSTTSTCWARWGKCSSGRIPGRVSRDDVTVYESLGVALEDLAAAHYIHRRALETGAGTWLEWSDR